MAGLSPTLSVPRAVPPILLYRFSLFSDINVPDISSGISSQTDMIVTLFRIFVVFIKWRCMWTYSTVLFEFARDSICSQKYVEKLCVMTKINNICSSGRWKETRPKLVDVGLPWWVSGRVSTCQCRRHRFYPWVRKIPRRRKRQPTLVVLPGKSHGQRSLVGYILKGLKESDIVTEQQWNLKVG